MRKLLFLIAFCLIASTIDAKEFSIIDVVGDSLSAGVNPETGSDGNGYLQMLFGQFDNQQTIDSLWPGIQKFNSAMSGSLASEWANPAFGPMQSLIGNQPDLVIIYIGGNDFLFELANNGDFDMAAQDNLRNNLRAIINNLNVNLNNPQLVMLTYYDLFDGQSANLPAQFADFRQISQYALIGNQIIKDVGGESGAVVIDSIHDQFLHHAYGRDFGDTNAQEPPYVATPITNFDIHPNTAGYKTIHSELIFALTELKNSVEIKSDVSSWILY